MQVMETVGYKACHDKWKCSVAIMEENGQMTVRREEQGGADTIGMDDVRLEIRDCLVEERFKATTVLIVL